MKTHQFAIALVCLCAFWTSASHATKTVEDDFAIDGTAVTDAQYFGSSGSSAIEINANSIGLVSGPSGRQLHALFPTETLENAGDMLKASITFTTPTTIGSAGEELRIGLFDNLGRTSATELMQDTTYSSGSPNPDFSGLPGFFLELDVEGMDPTTDLDIRKSDPSTSGRLLATSSGFTSLGNGPDIGYVFAPETEYSVNLTVIRTAAGALNITADFGDESFTATDAAPVSYSFGMLALGASGGAFGSTNATETPDNGIDITRFALGYVPFEGPAVGEKAVDDDFVANGTGTSDAAYFGSSSSSAIETNPNSIGLVSGSSGRQLHALFATQELANQGDTLNASITFVTPDTVAMSAEDLRFGLFDHLERTSDTELGQNTSYGSSSPNMLFMGLPGFYLELDIDGIDATNNLDIRKSDPSTSGRLLATTTGFTSLGSGSDLDYVFAPNTEYTVDFSIVRNAADGLDITAFFGGGSNTVTDDNPNSYSFGMLAVGASGGAVGSTNSTNVPDNGIDITKFSVELVAAEPPAAEPDPNKVVDDNFRADGTVQTDAEYFTTSNTNALERNADSLGLVSGPSGRAIHGLFDTQTLEQEGDLIRLGISFTTPATVAMGGEDLRIGLFDHLERNIPTQLAQNLTYSATETNPDLEGLPGFYLELDVDTSPLSDLDIRKSDPTTSGRLLTTTSGFTALGNGPNLGYVFEPETEYTVFLTVERLADDQLSVSANFLGRDFTVIDDAPLSFNFGMIALSASSEAFGSSRNIGDADNGIDISNIGVELIRANVVGDDFASDTTEGADTRYFGSSASSAIEFNDTTVGLVSGSSARQIHTLFDTQSLSKTGDALEVSIDFSTPATVALTNEDLRIGLFDHLGRNTSDRLAQNTSFNSSTPNADFSGLFGYYVELDVEDNDATTDFEVRKSDPSETGRSMTTSTGYTALAGSATQDLGYRITANSYYTVDLRVERTETGGLSITTDFLGHSQTVTDDAPLSYDFGMLALAASSGAFGSSNSVNTADNGIDLSRVSVRYLPFFDPEEVEIPPVELPTGDHPDVEIIPELPEGSGSGGNTGGGTTTPPGGSTGGSGSSVGITPAMAAKRAIPAIVSLVLDDSPIATPVEMTDAEKVAKYFGLNPNVGPWDNFDLSDWGLDSPNVDPADGFSARTEEFDLAVGNLFPGAEEFFFTGSDGAMVFKSIVGGARTSNNTSYPRTELREMLRAGDTSISTQGDNGNNWALGHQPANPNHAAREGRLLATLSIDQVTTTGSSSQLGRVIIGQIHAAKDEPIRLYYRKLPHNNRGVIYAAHEINNTGLDDIYFEIIGNRANSAPDPENGIALGELFSYEINNVGALIEVVIRRGDRDGPIIATTTIDMDNVVPGGSGYDLVDEWMYFKAGAYTQNNSGWANDFDQVRFYRLDNIH